MRTSQPQFELRVLSIGTIGTYLFQRSLGSQDRAARSRRSFKNRSVSAYVVKMAEGSDLALFDLRVVHDNFDRALVEDDDVDIKAYLEAYNELYK